MDYELDLNRIKPKNTNKSDKYSKQIYQYLKRNPHRDRVYYIQTQDIWNADIKQYEEKEIPFDINNFMMNKIWIGRIKREKFNTGYINWIYGNCLSTIVSNSKQKYEIFANPWYSNKTVVDITEQFWERYIKIGRCIYDYNNHDNWLTDSDDRFTYLSDTHRVCNWCGLEQNKEIYIHQTKITKWVSN